MSLESSVFDLVGVCCISADSMSLEMSLWLSRGMLDLCREHGLWETWLSHSGGMLHFCRQHELRDVWLSGNMLNLWKEHELGDVSLMQWGHFEHLQRARAGRALALIYWGYVGPLQTAWAWRCLSDTVGACWTSAESMSLESSGIKLMGVCGRSEEITSLEMSLWLSGGILDLCRGHAGLDLVEVCWISTEIKALPLQNASKI